MDVTKDWATTQFRQENVQRIRSFCSQSQSAFVRSSDSSALETEILERSNTQDEYLMAILRLQNTLNNKFGLCRHNEAQPTPISYNVDNLAVQTSPNQTAPLAYPVHRRDIHSERQAALPQSFAGQLFVDTLQRVILENAASLSTRTAEVFRRTLQLMSNKPMKLLPDLIENCNSASWANNETLDEVDVKILELKCESILRLNGQQPVGLPVIQPVAVDKQNQLSSQAVAVGNSNPLSSLPANINLTPQDVADPVAALRCLSINPRISPVYMQQAALSPNIPQPSISNKTVFNNLLNKSDHMKSQSLGNLTQLCQPTTVQNTFQNTNGNQQESQSVLSLMLQNVQPPMRRNSTQSLGAVQAEESQRFPS